MMESKRSIKPAKGTGGISTNSTEASIAIDKLDKEGKLLPLLSKMAFACKVEGAESSPAVGETFDPVSAIRSLDLATDEATVAEAIASLALQHSAPLTLETFQIAATGLSVAGAERYAMLGAKSGGRLGNGMLPLPLVEEDGTFCERCVEFRGISPTKAGMVPVQVNGSKGPHWSQNPVPEVVRHYKGVIKEALGIPPESDRLEIKIIPSYVDANYGFGDASPCNEITIRAMVRCKVGDDTDRKITSWVTLGGRPMIAGSQVLVVLYPGEFETLKFEEKGAHETRLDRQTLFLAPQTANKIREMSGHNQGFPMAPMVTTYMVAMTLRGSDPSQGGLLGNLVVKDYGVIGKTEDGRSVRGTVPSGQWEFGLDYKTPNDVRNALSTRECVDIPRFPLATVVEQKDDSGRTVYTVVISPAKGTGATLVRTLGSGKTPDLATQGNDRSPGSSSTTRATTVIVRMESDHQVLMSAVAAAKEKMQRSNKKITKSSELVNEFKGAVCKEAFRNAGPKSVTVTWAEAKPVLGGQEYRRIEDLQASPCDLFVEFASPGTAVEFVASFSTSLPAMGDIPESNIVWPAWLGDEARQKILSELADPSEDRSPSPAAEGSHAQGRKGGPGSLSRDHSEIPRGLADVDLARPQLSEEGPKMEVEQDAKDSFGGSQSLRSDGVATGAPSTVEPTAEAKEITNPSDEEAPSTGAAANADAGAKATTTSRQGSEGGPGSPYRGLCKTSRDAAEANLIRPQQSEEGVKMEMDQEAKGLKDSSDPDAFSPAGTVESSPSKIIGTALKLMSVGDKGATSVHDTRERVATFEIEEDQAGTSTIDDVMRASQAAIRALHQAIREVKVRLEDDEWNTFMPAGAMKAKDVIMMMSNAAGGATIRVPSGAEEAIVGDNSVSLAMEASAALQDAWEARESVSRIVVPNEPSALKLLRHSGVVAAKARTDQIETVMADRSYWESGVNDDTVQTFLLTVIDCVRSCATPEWLATCKTAADSKTVSCFGDTHAERLILEMRGDDMKDTRMNLGKMCKQLHNAVLSVKLTDRAAADAVAAGVTHVWATTSAGIAKSCLERGKQAGGGGEQEARALIATKISQTFQEQVLARSKSILGNLEGGRCTSVDAEMEEAAGSGSVEVPETEERSVEGRKSCGGVMAGGDGELTKDEGQLRRPTSSRSSLTGSPEIESQVTAGPKRGAHSSRDHGDEGTGQVTSDCSPMKKPKKSESKSSEVDSANILPRGRRLRDSGSRSKSPCDTEEENSHNAGISGNGVRSSRRGGGSAQ
jgi:hypothetical protein